MSKRRRALSLAAAALGLSITPLAAADSPCPLVRLTSLPLETRLHGDVAVPATVNGKAVSMIVDTGSFISSLGYSTVNALGLELKPSDSLGTYENGVPVFFYTHADNFTLGSATGRGLPFFVVPAQLLGSGASGLLGPDIMKNFDIEIDFAGGKFNVFEPNVCPRPPVYWTHEPFAEVPMKVDRNWKIIVTALLNGRPVTLVVDTGASRSLMSFEAAKDLFGWRSDDPNLKSVVTDINGSPAHVYRYRFATLTFEGIEVAYPDIDMAEGKNFDSRGRNDVQLILGTGVLRQLHLYIGYKAQKLYLTAAEAR